MLPCLWLILENRARCVCEAGEMPGQVGDDDGGQDDGAFPSVRLGRSEGEPSATYLG